MSDGVLDPRAERRLIFLLACIQFTHITDFVVMMPLGPQFMRVFSLEPHQFSLLVSVYSVSAAVFSLGAAFLVDRWDRKRSLIWVYLGFVVGTLLCGLSHTYPQLLIARVMAGAFGGTCSAICFAIVGDVIPSHRRGRAMGALMASFSVASVVGLPIGLFSAAHFGWETVFLGIAAIGCLVCGIVWRAVPPLRFHLEKEPTRGLWQEIREILQTPVCLQGLAFIGCVTATGFLIIPFLSPSLVSNAGVREEQLSWLYLTGGICTFFSSQAVGRLCDVWGHKTVFRWMSVIALVPLYLVTHLAPIAFPLILAACALFMMFVSGRMVPSMALITSLVPAQRRGAYMSLSSFVQQVSMGIASFTAGQLVARGADGRLLHFDRATMLAYLLTGAALYLVTALKPDEPALT
ncbi:MFS transporter [bacterium]|nr:MFS transporter [bacterium]